MLRPELAGSAGEESDYRVRFSAVASAPIAVDAAAALENALVTMPGIRAVGAVGLQPEPGGARVGADFVIAVRLGMADAARDGSRLAKEALKVAGMGEAKLVELSVTTDDHPGAASTV